MCFKDFLFQLEEIAIVFTGGMAATARAPALTALAAAATAMNRRRDESAGRDVVLWESACDMLIPHVAG
jgi:hypothetical protein